MHLDSILLAILTYKMNGLHVRVLCKHLLFYIWISISERSGVFDPDQECRNHSSVNEQRLTISVLAITFANKTNLLEFKKYTPVETAVF